MRYMLLRVADYSSRNTVCVCTDTLMRFGPGHRVLMGLMLGERERERAAVCSTIRKTETDVSKDSCFSQHFEHTHTQ